MGRPRWVLHYQARILRFLTAIGMVIHRSKSPRPRSPLFRVGIPITRSAVDGASIELVVYAPPGHLCRWTQSSASSGSPLLPAGKPALVNFHGGGFTIGTATDDSRFATAVVEETGALVISVAYRLAPEHPFPAAVQDGVTAVRWVIEHAADLGVDCAKIGLSGFSSGGNLCFSIALALAYPRLLPTSSSHIPTSIDLSYSDDTPSEPPAPPSLSCLVSFYPILDYTRTRTERTASNPGGPSRSLSPAMTTLFDLSYLPADPALLSHLLISPSLAPDAMLRRALPARVLLYTCGWDQLLVEGEDFRSRLQGLGDFAVSGRALPRVQHAWDKRPWPRGGGDQAREKVYAEACRSLREVWGIRE